LGATTDSGATADASAPLDASSDLDGADGTTSNDGGDAASVCADAGSAYVVFLDRVGGTYTAGDTDSTTNTSDLINQMTSIPAWTIAEPTWQAMRACVAQKFAPFNVALTELDPGTGAHAEVVFTPAANVPVLQGNPSIADIACQNRVTAKVNNPVAFVNITSLTDPNAVCAAVVLALGAALGLDTTTACPDAMTLHDAQCLTAGFSNTSLACDATAFGMATGCYCSAGTTQNSYQVMAAAVGLCN
jgi:hypothetical protein